MLTILEHTSLLVTALAITSFISGYLAYSCSIRDNNLRAIIIITTAISGMHSGTLIWWHIIKGWSWENWDFNLIMLFALVTASTKGLFIWLHVYAYKQSAKGQKCNAY